MGLRTFVYGCQVANATWQFFLTNLLLDIAVKTFIEAVNK